MNLHFSSMNPGFASHSSGPQVAHSAWRSWHSADWHAWHERAHFSSMKDGLLSHSPSPAHWWQRKGSLSTHLASSAADSPGEGARAGGSHAPQLRGHRRRMEMSWSQAPVAAKRRQCDAEPSSSGLLWFQLRRAASLNERVVRQIRRKRIDDHERAQAESDQRARTAAARLRRLFEITHPMCWSVACDLRVRPFAPSAEWLTNSRS